MTPLYVAYTPATGWVLITPASYAAPLAPGECCVRRANMAGGAQIHVRTLATAANPDWTGEPQIGRRAAQWLVDSGYARKQRGALVIDDRKVAADTVNLPVCWLEQQLADYQHLETFAPLLAQILLPGHKESECGRDFMREDDFWLPEWGEMPPFVANDEPEREDD